MNIWCTDVCIKLCISLNNKCSFPTKNYNTDQYLLLQTLSILTGMTGVSAALSVEVALTAGLEVAMMGWSAPKPSTVACRPVTH